MIRYNKNRTRDQYFEVFIFIPSFPKTMPWHALILYSYRLSKDSNKSSWICFVLCTKNNKDIVTHYSANSEDKDWVRMIVHIEKTANKVDGSNVWDNYNASSSINNESNKPRLDCFGNNAKHSWVICYHSLHRASAGSFHNNITLDLI